MISCLNAILFLLVTVITAAPGNWKRQSGIELEVSLTNTAHDSTEEFNPSTDGVPVLVNSTCAFDSATVRCHPDICIPEYHCTLYDKSLEPFTYLLPGHSTFDRRRVGQIICYPFLPQKRAQVVVS